MSTLIADMTMSVDGFVAFKNDDPGPIFEWYTTGPVEIETANPGVTLRTDAKSAEDLREMTSQVGALLTGRRCFDITDGWGGRHPVGCPVVVVSHSIPEGWPEHGEWFHFAGSIDAGVALARELAGDRIVAVATPSMTQQCLNLGLLDVLRVNIAPVLLGDGIPWFANLEDAPLLLEDPEVETGLRVTHLTYRVRRGEGAA